MKIDLDGLEKIEAEIDRICKVIEKEKIENPSKYDMAMAYFQGILFSKRALIEE